MNLFYLTQDINFQKALLLVAIIALILAILVSAYKLNSSVAIGQSWPPVVAPCPDYWDLSGNYCINSSWKNVGNLNYVSSSSSSLYSSQVPTCSDPSFCVIPKSIFGDKKTWATENHFVWDGLTSDATPAEKNNPSKTSSSPNNLFSKGKNRISNLFSKGKKLTVNTNIDTSSLNN
jgi:hypothetical protein